MAKRALHSKAIEMRMRGMSYSQIRQQLGVSKSSLSLWLKDYPLSEERIRALRDFSAQRIERCRETKARKREARERNAYERVTRDIGSLSDREIFLCGLFLYWGEGSKTTYTTVSLSNTDPSVLLFFLRWMTVLGVPRDKLRVHLHLYADMDISQEIRYWSHVLNLPVSSFRKPYVKASDRSTLTYTQRFVHGTCNILYENRDIGEYVHAAMESLRDSFVAVEP
jgi:hypothetical protein